MTAATDLWTSVVANYESEGLINLTNPRDNNATSVTTAYGQTACQEVIDLFPIYGQVTYEVFGDGGIITKLKRTSARARQGPNSNSGVQQKSELTSSGQKVRGWSDPDSLPGGRGYLPRRTIAED